MVPGRSRRRSLIRALGAAALGALVGGAREGEAIARELGADEVARLRRGELIRVPIDLDLAKGDYFGGISYALISAPPAAVMEALTDPASYPHILPLTLDATVLSKRVHDTQVRFTQGAKLGAATYVLVIRRESQSLIRFWLDPSEPHDIDDCWGYFRVEAWGAHATLLTFAALLHLEAGVVKLLFLEKIRKYALGTPALVRTYVGARRRHGPGPHEG